MSNGGSSDGSSLETVLNPVGTVKDSDGNISSAIKGGIAGLITIFFSALAVATDAVLQIVVDPAIELGNQLASLVAAYIPDSLLSSAVQTSSEALSQFGIFAYPMGMLIMAAGLYILAQLLNAPWSSNLFPFARADIPFVGDEEDE